MKKVEQTSLFDGPSDQPGDCMRASYASVLEWEAKDLPKWTNGQPWLTYFRNFHVFLRLKGYKIKSASYARPVKWKTPFDSYVATGPSPRTDKAKHCVVHDWGGFRWDPYPGANGLDGEPDLYEWLVEEDPTFEKSDKWQWGEWVDGKRRVPPVNIV